MNWNEAWNIALALLASVGGIGAIIVAISKFLAEKIADRLQAKYQLKLDEKFEAYKAGLENKNYVTRAQFDTEFEIYKKLTKSFFKVVVALNSITKDEYFKDKELFDSEEEGLQFLAEERKKGVEYGDLYVEAQDCLFENAAFIPENIFKNYEELQRMASKHYRKYLDQIIAYSQAKISKSQIWSNDDHVQMENIWEKNYSIINELREYLNSLSIID